MKKILILLAACGLTYFTSPLSAQNLPAYLPAEGLVGWWPFNGNANDESGNGNHGVVNGATLAVDRFGNLSKAYNFSGTQDIAVSVSNIPAGNQSRTFCSWFRTTGNSNPTNVNTNILGYPNVLMIAAYGTSTQGNVIFPQYVFAQNGKLTFESGSQMNLIYSSSAVNDNQWHQAVTTFDSSSGIVYLYVDGELVGTKTGVTLSTPATLMKIGNSPWANTRFIGDIDDVALYNRALTLTEIEQMYQGINQVINITPNITVPAFINYQAVARSANGDALANADVQVRFTLLADSLGGATEYSETHTLTTNALGLFTTAFGSGAPEVSTFDSIAWDNSNKFLRVELNAGNGYVDMGTQQLLSVPFALRSQSAAAIRNEHLPVFNDNAAAVTAGLTPGTMYRTSSGVLMVVY